MKMQISLVTIIVIALCTLAKIKIGLPPVIIVGGSGIIGLLLWIKTYRHKIPPASLILPPFLLTIAALEVHMMEEYFSGFAPAMSRLFDITWSEESFLIIFAFAGPVIYSLTALGLFFEKRVAGFVACFIFIGPGVAEFTHFIFPALRPALDPTNPNLIQHTFANGETMMALPNFYYAVTGNYYFPGLYTAALPMIPGIWGIYRLLKWSHQR